MRWIPSRAAADPRKNIGRIGERCCEVYLAERGYEILDRNWTCRYGEIDLVCRRAGRLVLVEVKTRLDSPAARRYLFENVTLKKRRKLELLAGCYLRKRRRFARAGIQIDVVGVLLSPEKLKLVELIHLPAAVGARD